MTKSDKYAGIDLGTNNCRLIVGEKISGNEYKTLNTFSRITRLGEGLAKTGKLSEAAMQRTVAALEECSKIIASYDNIRLRAVATEACRRAVNSSEFINLVKRNTGIHIEIISPEAEANLVLSACRPLVKPESKWALIFDIGGGSTELMLVEFLHANKINIKALTSIPMGVVTACENYPDIETNPKVYNNLVDEVYKELTSFGKINSISDFLKHKNVQFIGSSGTVTTLCAVALDMEKYNKDLIDGFDLSINELNIVNNTLRKMTLEERRNIPCIGKDRADLVIPGCAILEAIYSFWGVQSITIADRNLREGILYDLIAED